MAFTYGAYKESAEVQKKKAEAEAHKTYNESQTVTDARNQMNAHEQNKVAPWTGGQYQEKVQGAIDKIENRQAFSYDLENDVLWQQYKDKYITGGRLAMSDTIGQASAMTGGYGNSYATTAGSQAYQGYLQGMNDAIPELYQMALDKYNMDTQNLHNELNMYQNAYNTEYGEYRDSVADWNAEAQRLSDRYYNEANLDYSKFDADRTYYTDAYNNERTYDYGQYSDAYSRAFANYQQEEDTRRWNAEFAENNRRQQEAERLAREQQALNEKQYQLAVQNSNQSNTIAQKDAQIKELQSQLKTAKNTAKSGTAGGGLTLSEISKASGSKAVQQFASGIMTKNELSRRNNSTTIDGKTMRFDNYNQYVEYMLNRAYKNGKGSLTESETVYLYAYYGL